MGAPLGLTDIDIEPHVNTLQAMQTCVEVSMLQITPIQNPDDSAKLSRPPGPLTIVPPTEDFSTHTSSVFGLASLLGLNVAVPSNYAFKNRSDQSNNSIVPLTHAKIFGFQSISNLLFTFAYVYFSVWVYMYVGDHLGVFFQGVDYYTLTVDVVANFVQTAILLVNARLKGSGLVQIFSELSYIFENIRGVNPEVKISPSLKILSRGIVIFILINSVVYGIFFMYVIFIMTLPHISRKGNNMMTVSFVSEKIGHIMMPLYSQTVVAMFIGLTEVVCQIYDHLAARLHTVLKYREPEGYPLSKSESIDITAYKDFTAEATCKLREQSEGIESCRIIHHKLVECLEAVSDYFGGSLLLICCTSMLSITAALYTIILFKADQSTTATGDIKEDLTSFFIMWGFHLLFTFFNMGGILWSGQRIIRKVTFFVNINSKGYLA